MSKKIYSVTAIGNFYGGRYYEQGLDVFFVLARSSEEAKEISNNNIEEITEMFKSKVYQSGRKAIAKKDKCLIKVGATEPRLTSNTSFHKVLTEFDGFKSVNIEED